MPSELKGPMTVAMLGIVGGIFIAIIFGVNEGIFKEAIKEGLKSNEAIQSIVDVDKKSAKLKKEEDKNWRYYQRFHFHASAIGAMSVALLLLLNNLPIAARRKTILGWFLSVSGFLYPFVWLFAAIYGPSWGRGVAKEKFAIFGYMGGVYLLSVLVLVYFLYQKDEVKASD